MKVSVLMIAYNQEKYIAQALDSVLMQNVDFEYEIVIGEDCSTDGTRDIVLAYQRNHPNKIRALLPEKNLGMLRNFAQTYYSCNGDYVAILEGDDFWTSTEKLQKQVDFLENHPESALCFHATNIYYEDTGAFGISQSGVKEFSSIENLLENNFIQTCSVMFRNRLIGNFPSWFFSGIIGDYPLHLLNAEFGSIGFLDEVMATYRVHSGGVWSMQAERNFVKNTKATIVMFNNLNLHFNKKYNSIIKRKIYEYELALYKRYLRDRRCTMCINQAMKLILRYPLLLVTEKIKYEIRAKG